MTTQSPAQDAAVPAAGINSMNSAQVFLTLLKLSERAKEERQTRAKTRESTDNIIPRDILAGLMTAVETRDVRTAMHCRRVAVIASGIASMLGWNQYDTHVLEVACLLHDLGKIGVPDHILFKPGELGADEADMLDAHHKIGLSVLQACAVDHGVLEIIAQSNSHYNGAGDNYRRIGSDMHQGARILCVADAFDSLSYSQAFREAKSEEEIFGILAGKAGTKFDGNVVAALQRWLNSGGREQLAEMPDEPDTSEFSSAEVAEATALCNVFGSLYLLEHMYCGFHVIDADHRFVVWHAGLTETLGYEATELLGEKWSSRKIAHADEFGETALDSKNCPAIRAMTDGKAQTQALQVKAANGSWKRLEMHAVPLIVDGQVAGVAEIVRDLSKDRKRDSVRDLELAASRDALTQVANRGQLEKQLADMLDEYGKRSDPEPFSLMFIDVDFFKSINDTHGHGIGDRVLIDLARLLQNETYSGELVARYGGEEFVLVCPDNDLEAAQKKAERIRRAIKSAELGGLKERRVSASFGVTEVEPKDTIDSLFKRADLGVYRAKEGGRDRTICVTGAELRKVEKKEKAKNKKNPFEMTDSFEAFLTPETSTYKLGGFIDDNQAKLLKVKEGYARFRVGKPGGFGGKWGKTEDKQPVEVTIQFGDIKDESPTTRGRAKRIAVNVVIKPAGRPRSIPDFETRANHVLKDIRAYFVASTE